MPDWPFGEQALAARIRDLDWAATPLGPISGWPQSLKTVVDIMLASPSMMSLVWGREATHLYNDAFTELLREHDERALGKSAFESFARSQNVFAADIAVGMAGRSARLTAQRYPVLRDGALQDAWFDVDYVPVRDDTGEIGGVLWSMKEVTAEVLARRALGEREARQRLLIRSWAQAEWETDADGVVVADSPSWRAYTGQTINEWLGYGWLQAIHPEDRAYAERQWREAIAARRPVNAEFRLRAPDGGWRWTNFRAAPMFDAAGAITKWAGMNIDIDAGKKAEAALRESDERIAQLADAAPVLIWETDAGGATFVNRHYLSYAGADFDSIAGFGWTAFVHPDDLDGYTDAYRRAFETRQSYQYECRLRRADGQYRWHHARGGPTSNGRFIGSSMDIHDLVMAQRGLREREERLRLALEVGRLAIWEWDLATGDVHWSDEHYAMQGYAVGEVTPSYEAWAARVHPDDLEGTEAALHAAREGTGDYAHEFRSLHPDGSVRWLSSYGRFFRDDQGVPDRMVGAMIDVTERREWAEGQKVLLAELQHRVRNILAIIRSVVSRSDDGERSAIDYVQHLQGRLSALARTQVLLTHRAGIGIQLEDMIRDELLAQIVSETRFTLDGPEVELSAKAAEVLTLAIHELATNATKYGAFCRVSGRLSVKWEVETKDGEPWLSLTWTERGVPIVDAVPRRQGFGSELISRRIPYELKGLGSFVLKPGGLECQIAFPLRAGDSVLQTDGVSQ